MPGIQVEWMVMWYAMWLCGTLISGSFQFNRNCIVVVVAIANPDLLCSI